VHSSAGGAAAHIVLTTIGCAHDVRIARRGWPAARVQPTTVLDVQDWHMPLLVVFVDIKARH
jgi:hypothetical protein